MKNTSLLIGCLCTMVSGTLRHFDHAATDAAVATLVVAPALSAHPSFAVRVVGQGPPMLQTDLRPLPPRLALPMWVLRADATARQLLQQLAATTPDCRCTYAAQYAGTPRLILATYPTARHFLLDDVPARCGQQLDEVLTRSRPAPHPRA